MTLRPLLFVDVDGVLNRMGPQFPRKLPSGRGSPMHMAPETPGHVRKLDAAFECVWASEWRTRAQHVWGSVLGVNWPVLDYETAKLPKIEAWAAERPWAWVDDNGAESEMGLVLITEPEVGLTDQHVAELLAFAEDRR